jgi:hypothetical protein
LLGAMLAVIVCASASGSHVGARAVSAASFQDEVQLQLGENGFTPGAVQHAAGTFAIAVENTILTGEYTLQLKAQDNTVIKQVQVQSGSTAWTITLPAGEYTLSETAHSNWLCRITVQ